MKKVDKVGLLIRQLTPDEDQQQELWIHYLSGNPEHTLFHYLQNLSNLSQIENQIRDNLYILAQENLSKEFQLFISLFSPYEQFIIRLLILGLTTRQISDYCGIQEIRIKQTVLNLQYNDMWKIINPHYSKVTDL